MSNTNERAELIANMHLTAKQIVDAGRAGWGNACKDAADMLEADSEEIERVTEMAHSEKRFADMHYAEKMAIKAQQVAVPALMTDIEVLRAARTVQSVFEHVPHRDVIEFVRAIEAHHGIGAKP